MRRFILNELLKAEAQKNPHYWASVLSAHSWIGAGLWGVAAMGTDRWSAVILAPLTYLILWEITQLYVARRSFTRKLVLDSLLDTIAVAFGCIAAAYLRDAMMLEAMFAWASSIVVAAFGWRVRNGTE